MDLDLQAIAAYVRKASTEDLLNRVTVYREEMEPAAVDLMEGELARRGVSPEEIEDHLQNENILTQSDGSVVRCCFCDRPAIAKQWGWFKLWHRIPLFPQLQPLCMEHIPDEPDR